MDGLKVVGKSVHRYGGLNHVTGTSRFVDDVFVPGTLVVKALRSPVDKGRIVRLDTTKAEKLPGVPELLPPPTYPAILMGFSLWISLLWPRRM